MNVVISCPITQRNVLDLATTKLFFLYFNHNGSIFFTYLADIKMLTYVKNKSINGNPIIRLCVQTGLLHVLTLSMSPCPD